MILLAALALAGALQDELEARLDALAVTLEASGASGALARLLQGEAGRRAVHERIEAVVAARGARLDRDPQSAYEDWLFARDDRGALRLRPERRADAERLKKEVALARERMAPFFRRCDAFAARIAGEGEMEKAARAAWSDPRFRAAYFNLRAGELDEPGPEAILRGLLGAETLDALRERQEMAAELRPSYLPQVAALSGEAERRLLGSETGALLVLGRLLRQIAEGSERAVGGVSLDAEGSPRISLNLPLAELASFVREAEAVGAALVPAFEGAELRDPGLRALLAEAVLAERELRREVADGVFAEIVEDGFEQAGDGLRVRPGRYAGEDGKDSPAAFASERETLFDVFRGSRAALDQLVELCADPAEAAPFADAEATFVVHEHQERVIDGLRENLRERAFELFADLYLERKGARWAVRPERAGQVEQMGRRAAEIEKED